MGLFGTKTNSSKLILFFSPTSLSLGLVSYAVTRATLHAFEHISFARFEMHEGVIYNQSELLSYITNFLKPHHIRNPETAIILASGCIRETFLTLAHPTLSVQDLFFAGKEQAIWQYQYMYPHEAQGYVFYISALYPWIMYQYQELCRQSDLKLHAIISSMHTSLRAYKGLYGAAFRASQLSIDMPRCDGMLSKVVSADNVRRLLYIPAGVCSDIHTHKEALVSMIGYGVNQ